jgi:hypothetical protein
MVGQLSNFIKNFGKYVYSKLKPFFKVGKTFKDGGAVAANLFWNFNKLDDPLLNNSEKASAIFNAVTAPLSVIPIVGPILDITSTATPYIADVIEGRKDAPPIPADINSKINNLGSLGNKIVNSKLFKNFFGNW